MIPKLIYTRVASQLQAGQDVKMDITDKDGQTPLQVAVICEQTEAVETLLDMMEEGHTIDVDHQDNEGRSAVFLAAEYNRNNILLVSKFECGENCEV